MQLPTQLFTGLKPRPERMQPPSDESHHPWKPSGGLWTSTYRDGSSGWVDWCRDEGFRLDRVSRRRQWLLDPVECRVFRIETADEVEQLFAEYGVDWSARVFGESSQLGLRAFPHWNYWTLEWARFAADYDALWLASPWLDVDGMPLRLASMMFYGWDCESTWWARWSFENVRRP